MRHRRALWFVAVLCLMAAIQSQCGCTLGFREAPPVSPPVAHAAAIQSQFLWAILFGLLGVGVGVFMLIELPFKKLGLAVTGGSAAMIAAALSFSWVADHIGWFVLGASVIGAGVMLWGKMRLQNAAKAAWDVVPDNAVVASRAEALLNRLG